MSIHVRRERARLKAGKHAFKIKGGGHHELKTFRGFVMIQCDAREIVVVRPIVPSAVGRRILFCRTQRMRSPSGGKGNPFDSKSLATFTAIRNLAQYELLETMTFSRTRRIRSVEAKDASSARRAYSGAWVEKVQLGKFGVFPEAKRQNIDHEE